MASRGYPSIILSDNGKIFVGAVNKLKASMNVRYEAKIKVDLAQKKIVCKINPAGAPYFGGIWERRVQN